MIICPMEELFIANLHVFITYKLVRSTVTYWIAYESYISFITTRALSNTITSNKYKLQLSIQQR